MIRPDNPNTEFALGGINHVALVCSDMQRTVDFYSGVLGMPLIKAIDLPGGMGGQHFFFDAGNGDCVAFFWFTDAPDGVPGISAPIALPGLGEITSAVSTMNHLAFHVPPEKFDGYREKLKAKVSAWVPCSITTRVNGRPRRRCIPASTCGPSIFRIPTASHSNSPAG